MASKSTGIETFFVSPTDITNARIIYGPDLEGMQGRTVRKKTIMIET